MMVERLVITLFDRCGDVWGTQRILNYRSSSSVCCNIFGSMVIHHDINHGQVAADFGIPAGSPPSSSFKSLSNIGSRCLVAPWIISLELAGLSGMIIGRYS
jgi:hypothetical protein